MFGPAHKGFIPEIPDGVGRDRVGAQVLLNTCSLNNAA
jgi:hypothetical protein